MSRLHQMSVKMVFKLIELFLKPMVQSVEKTKEKTNKTVGGAGK